jgi:hypothetical protein
VPPHMASTYKVHANSIKNNDGFDFHAMLLPGLSLWTSFGKITSEGRRPDASGRMSESADHRRTTNPSGGRQRQTALGGWPRLTARADGQGCLCARLPAHLAR